MWQLPVNTSSPYLRKFFFFWIILRIFDVVSLSLMNVTSDIPYEWSWYTPGTNISTLARQSVIYLFIFISLLILCSITHLLPSVSLLVLYMVIDGMFQRLLIHTSIMMDDFHLLQCRKWWKILKYWLGRPKVKLGI